jgi:hypothetical protein
MANEQLAFPAVTSVYRPVIAQFRTYFQRINSYVKGNAGRKAAVGAQLAPLAAAVGYANIVPATSLVVASGVEVLAPAITGVYVNGYTLTIVDGAVTAIVAS